MRHTGKLEEVINVTPYARREWRFVLCPPLQALGRQLVALECLPLRKAVLNDNKTECLLIMSEDRHMIGDRRLPEDLMCPDAL